MQTESDVGVPNKAPAPRWFLAVKQLNRVSFYIVNVKENMSFNLSTIPHDIKLGDFSIREVVAIPVIRRILSNEHVVNDMRSGADLNFIRMLKAASDTPREIEVNARTLVAFEDAFEPDTRFIDLSLGQIRETISRGANA